ncbi:hypothetical protein F503_01397 [Ophiostoma piceae UAMH 11346]|uniref:Uncharacterized protein n=1 Tax=Ophiostoma piceae (strain UAMH 11346) TaxID=1262450 RepID=S3CDK2_OPHP1|nr:hypothetical protein F503_01397 [Ophiostoma piceae UAMH 11346]
MQCHLGYHQIYLIALGGFIETASFIINGGSGKLFVAYTVYVVISRGFNNRVTKMSVFIPGGSDDTEYETGGCNAGYDDEGDLSDEQVSAIKAVIKAIAGVMLNLAFILRPPISLSKTEMPWPTDHKDRVNTTSFLHLQEDYKWLLNYLTR